MQPVKMLTRLRFVRSTEIPNFTEMQLMRGLRLHENF